MVGSAIALVFLVGCAPPTGGWSVKEFKHKGHDYLMSIQGHLLHAEHCDHFSHPPATNHMIEAVTYEYVPRVQVKGDGNVVAGGDVRQSGGGIRR